MAKRIKDDAYLYISTRIKMRRKYLLAAEDFVRMANAPAFAEVKKTLSDKGYLPIEENNADSLEAALSARLAETLGLLYRFAPDRRVIDVFNLKYDYHNLKVLLKSPLRTDLLSQEGTVPAQVLIEAFEAQNFSALPEIMAEAVKDAVVIADLQKADIRLDKAMCAQMLLISKQTRSKFLEGYVKLYIDAANLKTAVRAARAGKDAAFISESLIPGGSLDTSVPQADPTAALVKSLKGGRLEKAAQQTEKLSAAALDRECDNALLGYAAASRSINYGEAHVIAYLLEIDAEISAVRLLVTARSAGSDPQKTLERLREL